jgi:hypothetical protein
MAAAMARQPAQIVAAVEPRCPIPVWGTTASLREAAALGAGYTDAEGFAPDDLHDG